MKRRKPGGGRKPKGPIKGKLANFSTRITTEMRGALEAEARASGVSVSQQAEMLLRLGLKWKQREREPGRNNPMSALCFAIAELGSIVCNIKLGGGKPIPDWRNNPLMFEAFKLSVLGFLDRLKPKGAVRPLTRELPELKGTTIYGPLDTPESRASHALTILWTILMRAKPVNAEELFGPEISVEMRTEIERTANALWDAKTALNLGDNQ